MVIQNRLMSLIYRSITFGIAVAALVMLCYCYRTFGTWELVRFDILITTFTIVVLVIEIIVNSIDLKNGIRGKIAPIWPPLMAAMVIYEASDIFIFAISRAILHADYLILESEVMTIFAHLLLPILVILDWLLFAEKGTVKWSQSYMILFFPIFYSGAILILETIQQSNALSLMYVSALNFVQGSSSPEWMTQASGLAGVAFVTGICFVVFIVITVLFIFFNDLIAGKYRHKFFFK